MGRGVKFLLMGPLTCHAISDPLDKFSKKKIMSFRISLRSWRWAQVRLCSSNHLKMTAEPELKYFRLETFVGHCQGCYLLWHLASCCHQYNKRQGINKIRYDWHGDIENKIWTRIVGDIRKSYVTFEKKIPAYTILLYCYCNVYFLYVIWMRALAWDLNM